MGEEGRTSVSQRPPLNRDRNQRSGVLHISVTKVGGCGHKEVVGLVMILCLYSWKKLIPLRWVK